MPALLIALGAISALFWRHAEEPSLQLRARDRDVSATRLLQAHSVKLPPAIFRPPVRDEIGLAEFDRALRSHARELCYQLSRASRFPVPADSALDGAWTDSGPELSSLLEQYTTGSLRRAAQGASSRVKRLSDESHSTPDAQCTQLAIIDILTAWPEAEPGTFLLDVTRSPASGSLRIVIGAIDAMAETGREDYIPELQRFMDHEDGRLASRAMVAAARISGTATSFLNAIDGYEPLADGVSNRASIALAASDPESAADTIDLLLASSEPTRIGVAARFISNGRGLPLSDRMELVTEALRATIPTATAVAMVRAIAETDDSAGSLNDLASDSTRSSEVRALAYLHLEGAAPEGLAFDLIGPSMNPSIAERLLIDIGRRSPNTLGAALAKYRPPSSVALTVASAIREDCQPELYPVIDTWLAGIP